MPAAPSIGKVKCKGQRNAESLYFIVQVSFLDFENNVYCTVGKTSGLDVLIGEIDIPVNETLIGFRALRKYERSLCGLAVITRPASKEERKSNGEADARCKRYKAKEDKLLREAESREFLRKAHKFKKTKPKKDC